MFAARTTALFWLAFTCIASAQQDPANPAANGPAVGLQPTSLGTQNGVTLTAFTDRNAWAATVGGPTTLIGFDDIADGTEITTDLASQGVGFVAGWSPFEVPSGLTRRFVTASTSLPFPMFTAGSLPSEPNFISNRLTPGVYGTGFMRFDLVAPTTAIGAYVADGGPLGDFTITLFDAGLRQGVVTLPPRALPNSFAGVISSAPFTSVVFTSQAVGDSWGLDDLEFAGALPLTHCGSVPDGRTCVPELAIHSRWSATGADDAAGDQLIFLGGSRTVRRFAFREVAPGLLLDEVRSVLQRDLHSEIALEIRATGAPAGAAGRLLYSLAEGSLPFGGGTLCLGAPVRGLALPPAAGEVGTGCSGSWAVDFGARALGVDPALVAGARVHAQLALRDAAGGRTILSPVIEFTLDP